MSGNSLAVSHNGCGRRASPDQASPFFDRSPRPRSCVALGVGVVRRVDAESRPRAATAEQAIRARTAAAAAGFERQQSRNGSRGMSNVYINLTGLCITVLVIPLSLTRRNIQISS